MTTGMQPIAAPLPPRRPRRRVRTGAATAATSVVLVNARGATLYVDTGAACTTTCRRSWKPYLLPQGTTRATGSKVVSGLGTVRRGGRHRHHDAHLLVRHRRTDPRRAGAGARIPDDGPDGFHCPDGPDDDPIHKDPDHPNHDQSGAHDDDRTAGHHHNRSTTDHHDDETATHHHDHGCRWRRNGVLT
jgi:hypothetical protein